MVNIPDSSRAEYFKNRRGKYKAFNVEVEKEKMEAFEKKLAEKKQSKKEWLDEKIMEELSK